MAAAKHVAKAANQADDARADDARADDGTNDNETQLSNGAQLLTAGRYNSYSLDETLDQAEVLGLLTEARRDTLTDTIARGEVTEAALEKEWSAKVVMYLRENAVE